MNNTCITATHQKRDSAGTKTLWIHIGGIKTGTTTLQQFLSANRAILKMRGFLYPGTGQSHWGITKELGIGGPCGSGFSSLPTLSGLLEEMKDTSCQSIIISAEDLPEPGAAEALYNHIPDTFSVKIIYYARRQDGLIESWYNQIAKSPLYPDPGELNMALVETHSRLFDHDFILRPWAGLFGRENIFVRPFEKRQMTGDIIRDFSEVIGLPPDSGFIVPRKQFNQRISPDQIEVSRLCKGRYTHSPELIRFLERNFEASRITSEEKRRHLLAPSERRSILERFEESNRRVAREFLGREDGRLFTEPWPDLSEPWVPYTGISMNALVPIVTELVFLQAMQERAPQPLQTFLGMVNSALIRLTGRKRSGRPPGDPAPVRRAPGLWRPGPATSEKDLEALRMCGTIEELVPVIVRILDDRNRQAQKKRSLSVLFLVINRVLTRVVSQIPVRKRRRLGHRFAGSGEDYE